MEDDSKMPAEREKRKTRKTVQYNDNLLHSEGENGVRDILPVSALKDTKSSKKRAVKRSPEEFDEEVDDVDEDDDSFSAEDTKKKRKKSTPRSKTDGYGDDYAKQTVEVGGKTIRCIDANHEQFCEVMDSANSASDLTQIQMMAFSVSRGDHTRNDKPGIRLSANPKQDAEGNALTGSQKDKLYENLKKYAAGSTNVCRGWPKTEHSKNCKEQQAAGLIDVDKQRTATNKAKGGTPAYRSVNVDPNEESVTYTQYQYTEGIETITATAFSILPTTAAGLAASENKNVAACVLEAMQLPKQDSNKNATTALKNRLQKLGMKMDPRVIDGRYSVDDKSIGWENRGLRFYFKGKCSDVTKNQVKLEPAKPPVPKKKASKKSGK